MNWEDTEEIEPSWDDTEEIPQVSKLESMARGAVQGIPAIGPWADEATGAIESLLTDKSYKQARDESRANYKAAEDANPGSYYSGMGGMALTTAIPKAIPVLGPLASGALGAIEGAGASENEDLEGIGKDALIAGGISAGTAGLGHVIGKGVSAGAKKFAPKVADGLEDFSKVQGARAVGLDKGLSKKLGKERVMEIGEQARDKGLFGLFTGTEEKAARNAALKEMAMGQRQGAYDAIDAVGASKFNPSSVAADVGESLGDFNRMSPLNSGKLRTLENTLDAIQQRGTENISMKEAQNLMNELRDAARWSGVGNKSPQEEMAQKAYMKVREAVNKAAGDASETVGLEGLKGVIESSNKTYSIAKDTDKLLNNQFGKDVGNKMFGLTDNIQVGAQAVGRSLSEASPYAAAVLAAKKAGEKYGGQIMSITSHKLADLVEKSPQALGKYGPILQKASQRGGNALGVTDFMLQQNDPEYRKMKKEMEGE